MIDDVRPPKSRKPKIVIEPPVPLDQEILHPVVPADDEPAFQPPEAVAAADDEPVTPLKPAAEAPKKQGLKRFVPRTRKQQIVCGIILILLAFGAGAGWTLTHHKRAVVAEAPKKSIAKKAAPQITYSTLTGLPITDASLNQKPVTAVMVENSVDARPQSGLGDAGVVFEAVAEGGVTRFMALYQDTAPTNVGPVRSARPYYVQWAMGFDAAYAHVGGSTDALNDIKSWGVKDMNQFYNGTSYHRISSRAAPHNVYTGIDTLNKLEAAKGFTSTYTGFARTKKEAPAATPTASSIKMSLSGYTYDPSYTYNRTTNSYDRSEAGSPQTDANTNKQISPKVVVAIVVPESRGALDSSGAYYSNYNPIGAGAAYIFQNGTATVGQWTKSANASPLQFTDTAGKPLPLAPGQTWITAVTAANKVTYK